MKTRQYWSLSCASCDCDGVLVRCDSEEPGAQESILIFPSKELAQVAASELEDEHGRTPPVVRINVTRVD